MISKGRKAAYFVAGLMGAVLALGILSLLTELVHVFVLS